MLLVWTFKGEPAQGTNDPSRPDRFPFPVAKEMGNRKRHQALEPNVLHPYAPCLET